MTPNTLYNTECIRSLPESKLATPIANWLREKGCIVYAEIPYWSSCIDLIGMADDKLYAVELKVCLTNAAFRQAERTRGFAHFSYVGVPSTPRKSSMLRCAKYGIGILRVTNGIAEEILAGTLQKPVPSLTEHILGNLHNCSPSDDAGKPMLKGIGPAQEVAKEVRAYKAEHPQAKWKEIYENVPNYYCSYRSMCNALVSRGLVR